MKIILLFIFAALLFIISCSNSHHNNLANLKASNDSLTLSNQKIKNQNDSIYQILKNKLQDGGTAEVAILWVPKALYLKYQSDQIYTYLDTLNSQSAGFINGDSLYRKLRFYKDKILRIDPDIYNEINKNAEIITHDFDSIRMRENLGLYFSDKSNDQVHLILNQAKNNIESIENEILEFCNNKIK